jgi:hypothetical protein
MTVPSRVRMEIPVPCHLSDCAEFLVIISSMALFFWGGGGNVFDMKCLFFLFSTIFIRNSSRSIGDPASYCHKRT